MAVVLQVRREFAGQCGLASALQAGEHDDGGSGLGELDLPGLTTEDLDEFLMHDLDDLLRRVQRARDLRRQCALLDARGERANDRQRDVGFKQSGTDFANGRVDIRFS